MCLLVLVLVHILGNFTGPYTLAWVCGLGLVNCHIPAKLRLKPSWVGCIIGFDKNPNPNHVPTYLDQFQINYEAGFRNEVSVTPNQMMDAKK